MGITLGKNLDLARLDEGVRRARRDGIVESLWVRFERRSGGAVLVLEGAPLRRLRKLQIEGVSDSLAEEMRVRAALEEGRMASLSTIEYFRERSREVLENRGYYSPKLDLELVEDEAHEEATLMARIDPGPRTVIGSVRVEGAPKQLKARVDLLVPLRRGDALERARVASGSAALVTALQAEQYPAARVIDVRVELSADKREADVVYRVEPGDRLLFLFEGNRFLPERQLRTLIQPESLSQADGPQLVAQAIRDRYLALGFAYVTVEPKKERDEKAQRTFVRFRINEGPRVRIDRLAFVGSNDPEAENLPKYYYEGADPVLGRGVYVEKAVDPATKALEARLRSIGYLSASIGAARTTLTDDRKGADLQFEASLGPQTRLLRYEIRGNESVSPSRIESLFSVKAGAPFDQSRVVAERKLVLDLFRNEGFLDVRYRSDADEDWLELSRDRSQATVILDLVEGPRYRLGSVRVSGLKKTQEKVVRREIALPENEPISPDRVRETEDRLSSLGIFSQVEARLDDSGPAKKDLELRLRESKPGLGEVGFGALYEDPRVRLRGFLGLAYRNLFGLNHVVSARTQLNLPISRNKELVPFIEYFTVLGYQAPYVFDLPVRLGLQIGFDNFEISPVGPELQSRVRTEIRLEKRFGGRKVLLIYRVHRFEQARTRRLDTNASTVDSIGSTGPGIVLDFRDDVFNPRKGSFHTFDVELAHPTFLSRDNIGFVMGLSRNSLYIPLPRPFGFATYLGVGYARSILADQPVPKARLSTDLALGGQGSIRGFSVRRFSPSDRDPLPRAAAFYNARFELTSKVVEDVSLATFLDSGQIFPGSTSERRHDGIGVGVRYKTPVGPVSVDFAQGLGRDRESVKFYFSVGTL